MWLFVAGLIVAASTSMPSRAQKMPVVEPRKGNHVGNIAHILTLEDLDGRSYDLESIQGERVVQVVFWATWCMPCIEEIPKLREMYDKYHEEGFELLGVVVPINQTRGGARAFAEKFEINYPILWDKKSMTMDRYGVASIPHNFIIGKDGIIRYSGVDLPQDYEKLIQSLLQEGAGKKTVSR